MPHGSAPARRAARGADPEQLYRLIADTIPRMVWTGGADGALDYFNRRVLEYTGLSARRLAGWGWQQVIHPGDLPECVARWKRALATGERYEVEYRLRRRDTAYRWHLGSALPLRDGVGRIVRWFGTCTDIEAQKSAAGLLEQARRTLEALVESRTLALRASEGRLRSIVELQPECVKLLDGEGRVIEMNAAGLRALEVESLGEIAGRVVYGFVAPEYREAFRDLTERVCRGERGTLQFELVGRKGTRRWLETQAVPFRDESRGETFLLAITRDVTEQRNAAREMRRLLDRLVSAQEAERRRISLELHDVIGQKLTALGIGLNILRHEIEVRPGDALDARLDHLTGLLEETVDEIRGIVKDLRPPVLEDYGLVAALHWHAERFSRHGGLRVLVAAPDAVPRLASRKELALFRIVQEAVANAAKHSGGAEVRVSVGLEGRSVRVSIEDDGGGLAARDSAAPPGSEGLGFTAMRERAESVGGTLAVEPGAAGLRIAARIPRDDADPDPAR